VRPFHLLYLGITAGSRTGRCIFYIRGRRGNAHTSYSGPRRIKSFAWRSRYFITFLYFEKCAAGRPVVFRPVEFRRMCTCTLSFLYVHARNMRLSSRVHVSALCLHIFVCVSPFSRGILNLMSAMSVLSRKIK
jgi:hypothetical protein